MLGYAASLEKNFDDSKCNCVTVSLRHCVTDNLYGKVDFLHFVRLFNI